jgi:hypothetical protein
VNARQVLSRSTEWVVRSHALREARAAVKPRGDRRDQAVRQARLLLEVARRVAEPVERFPPGSRAAVGLGLYRQAVYWIMVASRPVEAEAPPDLAAAWAGEEPDRLRRAAQNDASPDALKQMLVDRSAPDPLDVAAEDAARARAFAEALLADLDAPRRQVDRLLVQRWWRISLVTLVLLIAAVGVRKLVLGPNLAANRPFRVSSSWSGCASDPGCQALLFHAEPEMNPWIEFDLGAPKKFKRIEVTNRSDCCGERAIPLVAEMSNDRATWKEIARQETEFTNWTATFPPKTARYVRLRVPRFSTFHLKDVAIR